MSLLKSLRYNMILHTGKSVVSGLWLTVLTFSLSICKIRPTEARLKHKRRIIIVFRINCAS